MSSQCELLFAPNARDDLKELDKAVQTRIFKKLIWLAENCDVVFHEPLSGPLSGNHKLRVGDYRVIYRFERDPMAIVVIVIGHRSEIYKL